MRKKQKIRGTTRQAERKKGEKKKKKISLQAVDTISVKS